MRIAVYLFLFLAGNYSFSQVLRGDENVLGNNFRLSKLKLEYFEDKENSKLNFINFPYTKLERGAPNFGFIQHDVWFKLIVINNQNKTVDFILSLNNANLDRVELNYIVNDKIHTFKKGDLVEKHLDLLSRKNAFQLKLAPNEKQIFYLKVNNGGEQFHFSPKIDTPNQFKLNENNENFFIGIYIGLLLFIFIFNFFMSIVTKEKLSRYYSFYLITLLLLQLSLLGYGKIYIWGNVPYLINHANPIFASLSVIGLLIFSQNYLELKRTMPIINKVFSFILLALVICALLAIIPTNLTYTSSIIIINATTLLLNCMILPVGLIALKRGYKSARIFVIAFFLLVVFVFAFILKNFGILPSNFLTDFGFQIGSAAEVTLFSLGIVFNYQNHREKSFIRLKEISNLKQEANIVLEQKVIERTTEIEKQKHEISEKNEEILSSINYAKRIQEAILPTQDKIDKLLPTSSIWYAPKDIVSGDFYWIEDFQVNKSIYTFFAVADCTGHGVPGAMMSVLCSNSLKESLTQLTIPSTAVLLEKTCELLSSKLNSLETNLQDGMDIALVCWDQRKNEISWSGANNPLWILREGQIIEFEPTKRPIGRSLASIPFEEEKISLIKGDRLILFSDGIVDQFGGPNGKKFKKKRLRDLLMNSELVPESKIHEEVRQNIFAWQGNLEQVDDILFMDVKI